MILSVILSPCQRRQERAFGDESVRRSYWKDWDSQLLVEQSAGGRRCDPHPLRIDHQAESHFEDLGLGNTALPVALNCLQCSFFSV